MEDVVGVVAVAEVLDAKTAVEAHVENVVDDYDDGDDVHHLFVDDQGAYCENQDVVDDVAVVAAVEDVVDGAQGVVGNLAVANVYLVVVQRLMNLQLPPQLPRQSSVVKLVGWHLLMGCKAVHKNLWLLDQQKTIEVAVNKHLGLVEIDVGLGLDDGSVVVL